MPLHRWRIGGSLALLIALTISAATPAHALRVATWNVARYSGAAGIQPALRTVVAGMNADVIILQELNSVSGRNEFLNNVLNNVQPGEWAATSWLQLQAGPTEGGAIFYKPAKVSLSNTGILATSGPRDALRSQVQLVGYNAASTSFWLYSIHFKAGNGGTDSTNRRLECTDIRSVLNGLAAGTNILLGGDTNFYGAWEYGYLRLTEIQLDNDGRLKDPLFLPGNWHTNSGYAVYQTQSPCFDAGDCPSGFTSGGMDDRFDIIFTSFGMQNGEGLDYVEDFNLANGAMPFVYGNDGQHGNQAINGGGFNNAVGITIANALHEAADHLPVIMTLQVPAKIVADSQLNFGPVIIGATADQTHNVTNGAGAPADELDYTYSAPAGFSAPGGGFALEAGNSFGATISMNTASTGIKTGTLTVSTDDPDSTSKPVKLSGTVLRHAVASLDSSAITTSSMVDFGDYAIGYFADQMLRVHNQGFDALQARLSQSAANITGGDGRFFIVGGFSPTLIGAPAKTWNLHFNDAGATLDNTYTATLTFSNADEPLPGATAAADLTVTLRAKPVSTTTGIPERELPKTLAFYAPHPNPLGRETFFTYDLPAAAPVSLAIYDLSGRRVASLVSGTQEADRYQVRWQAVAESGQPVPAGLYFARFSTPGLTRLSRLIVIP